MPSNILILALRAAQMTMSLVVLGLSAYVSNWYNSDMKTASPNQVNFLIFASLYSMISVAFLEMVPRMFPRASNPYVSLGVEFTNVVFWFAGFISLAVFLSKLLFCRGSVCGAARADVAFGAFLWVTWTVSQVFLALNVFKGGFRKPTAGGKAAAAAAAGPNSSMKETMA